MRRVALGLFMAASLAGAPSAQAQTAVFVTSGMGGGASSTARLAAFQMSQQGAIQTHQKTLATLESRVAALEGGGGGVDIQPFVGAGHTCPAGYSVAACWCENGGNTSQGLIIGAGCFSQCSGVNKVFGLCKK